MSKPVVTEANRARASRLIDAMKAGDVAGVAAVFAESHEDAVSCATIRVEREFSVRARKVPQ